ncbi:hypothetical protein BDV37DRAFT_242397 [Aspergillus pseudonomiae]|uniref:Uncharacterized protein n=1 Tax=Aspergillus pseudonomiae TaxID=1506151 RepID=A0A5N7DK18_9EURO|nr:uncharacterized protein BDV37DRAFT_242397 [Aspergillus pseudonomiae]KAE8406684.1 hypothetical protein BDV37DRAFT_242397 [Aspergillus pseudonomiae]
MVPKGHLGLKCLGWSLISDLSVPFVGRCPTIIRGPLQRQSRTNYDPLLTSLELQSLNEHFDAIASLITDDYVGSFDNPHCLRDGLLPISCFRSLVEPTTGGRLPETLRLQRAITRCLSPPRSWKGSPTRVLLQNCRYIEQHSGHFIRRGVHRLYVGALCRLALGRIML